MCHAEKPHICLDDRNARIAGDRAVTFRKRADGLVVESLPLKRGVFIGKRLFLSCVCKSKGIDNVATRNLFVRSEVNAAVGIVERYAVYTFTKVVKHTLFAFVCDRAVKVVAILIGARLRFENWHCREVGALWDDKASGSVILIAGGLVDELYVKLMHRNIDRDRDLPVEIGVVL